MSNSSEDLKALVTNIQGFSTEDGPGIRTTIFFKGCPLTCPWCHNPEGILAKSQLLFRAEQCIGCKSCIKVCAEGAPVPGGPGSEKCRRCFACADICPPAARQRMGRWYSIEDLLAEVLKDRTYYETSGGGVTASGGEAMLWADFVATLFRKLKGEGIHTALDTSGAIGGDRLSRVLTHTDLALVDLKIMDPDRHRELIGFDLASILDNIRAIDRSGVPVVVRVPVVPGYTDSQENIVKITTFVAELKSVLNVDLLPYHRMAEAKYLHLGLPWRMGDTPPPTTDKMLEIKGMFEKAGVRAVIPGTD